MKISHSRSPFYFSDVALSVFIEEQVEQRKVLCIGDSLLAAQRLADIAEEVQLLCKDGALARSENERVFVGALGPGPLPFGDARFDVVVVPELSDLGDELEERLGELRRVLREDGLLVAGIANQRAFAPADVSSGAADRSMGYEQLTQMLSRQFDAVRIVGQMPFVGYSLVDLSSSGEPTEISFDGTLVEKGSQVPSRFIALCANDEVAIDEFTVVQIPNWGLEAPKETFDRGAIADPEESRLHEREVRGLETSLSERSAEVRELREELERRGALVRDLIEHAHYRQGSLGQGEQPISSSQQAAEGRDKEPGPAAPPAGDTAPLQAEINRLRAEREAAVTRALEAEAARLEALLRLDEVSGYLAISGREPKAEGEAADDVNASLAGAVRGLRSLVAEIKEARDTSEANHARENAALRGERDGWRSRALDCERSLEEIAQYNAEVLRSSKSASEQLESLRLEVAEVKTVESVLQMQLIEAESDLERERQRGEKLSAEQSEREAKVERLSKELSEREKEVLVLERSVASFTAELERLQQKLQAAKEAEARVAAAERRVEQLEGALGETLESLTLLADAVSDVGLSETAQRAGTAVGVAEPEEIDARQPSVARGQAVSEPGETSIEFDRLRAEVERLSRELDRELGLRETIRSTLRSLQEAVAAIPEGQSRVADLLRLLGQK